MSLERIDDLSKIAQCCLAKGARDVPVFGFRGSMEPSGTHLCWLKSLWFWLPLLGVVQYDEDP